MNNTFKKNSVISNVIWKLIERFSSLLVTLLTNIILTRMLQPSDFGLLAIVNVFIAITMIFVTGGVGNSLIQKKNANIVDFSSLFWFNLLISVILFIIIFMISPLIGRLMGNLKLIPILRVLSLELPIAAVYSIQGAYVSKKMMFRHYFFSTLAAKILSGIIGIAMAYSNFGVWGLVAQSVSLLILETIILWFKIDWRPKKVFSWESVLELYPFAWKLMLRSLVETLSNQIRILVIGNQFKPAQLAYYERGNLFPNTITTNIASSTSAVMFPVISNQQENKLNVLNICRRWVKNFAYLTFPLLIGLILVSPLFIEVVFTRQWLPSVPYLKIACIVYMTWTIEIPIRETLKSIGYSNIILKMELYKTIVSIIILFLTVSHGVFAISLGVLVGAIVNVLISIFYGKKYFEYKIKFVILDVLPTAILSFFMIIGLNILSMIMKGSSVWFELGLSIIVGMLIYILGSSWSKNENYIYCVELIKGILN